MRVPMRRRSGSTRRRTIPWAGLWVDYNLMTSIPGLYAIGEANFSDHGANRLGASSMMQCLADGYFILPQTIGDYLHDIYSGQGPRGSSGLCRA